MGGWVGGCMIGGGWLRRTARGSQRKRCCNPSLATPPSAPLIHTACPPPAVPCSSPPLPCPLQYWKRMRAPDAQFGGVDGSGCTFLQTAAEKLDVPDNSQDIVYCVYLFHE